VKIIKIVPFLVLLTSINCLSQSINRQIVSSSGGSYSLSKGNISFTVGETFVANYTRWNEGFNQGNINFITGTLKASPESNIKIFPNPVNSKVTISTIQNEVAEIYCYDLEGHLVFKQNNSSFENEFDIDLSEIKPGYYILKIFDRSKSIIASQNFIKL